MTTKGFSRIGSSPFDPGRTKDSYENVLAFKNVRSDAIKTTAEGVKEAGICAPSGGFDG
jgi:hypothetical protein